MIVNIIADSLFTTFGLGRGDERQRDQSEFR